MTVGGDADPSDPSGLRAVDEIVDQRPPDAAAHRRRLDEQRVELQLVVTGRGREADDAAVVDRDTGASFAQRRGVVLERVGVGEDVLTIAVVRQ